MTEKIVPDSASDLGNTITKSPKKQVNKAKNWVFTFNNYNSEDLGLIVPVFDEKCQKWIFQEETGENGTPHLQGCIFLKEKMRPSELKLSKKIHWELMKGTEMEAIKYCSKNETRTGQIFKSNNIIIPRPLKIIEKLRPFQKSLEDIILTEPDDRTIIWIYDKRGNIGKSAFARYLIHKYNVLYITEGKKADILNLTYNYVLNFELNCVVLDVPRANENNVSYKSLEEIKNGMICNTKYETGMKLINPPHIIVFCNSEPDIEQFTSDRWKIFEIDENYNLIEITDEYF